MNTRLNGSIPWQTPEVGTRPLREVIDEQSMEALGSTAINMLRQTELDMLAGPRTTEDFRRARMLRDIVADLPPAADFPRS